MVNQIFFLMLKNKNSKNSVEFIKKQLFLVTKITEKKLQ